MMRVLVAGVIAGFLSHVALAVTPGLDPIENMCHRFDHQSIIKNDTLYILGGIESFSDFTQSTDQINQVPTGPTVVGYNNYLLEVDMSGPWNWRLNISETALAKNETTQPNVYPGPLVRGVLFHGGDQDPNIYAFGGTTSYVNTSFPGFQDPQPANYSLWAFNILTKVWTPYDLANYTASRPSSGSYTELRDDGLGFFFMGQLDSGSSVETVGLGDGGSIGLDGMMVVNTTERTAKNVSTKAMSGGLPRTRGRMAYLETIGSQGGLFQIGGNQNPVGSDDHTTVGDLVPMDEIDIFDVASMYDPTTPDGVWYKQKATGDVPSGRLDFCVVLASAPDSSSHNIYIYGGRGADNVFYDDLYILSIPSFIWVKAYNGTNYRAGLTCHRAGSKTMISVGGIASTNYNNKTCDFESKGVHVLDMSDIHWSSTYNGTSGEYTIPDTLVKAIGGSSIGEATKNAPDGGYNNTALQKIMEMNTASTGNKSSPASTPPPPKSSSSHHRAAIIAGSVIGGVVAIVLFLVIVYMYRQHIHRLVSGSPDPTTELPGESKVKGELMAKEQQWELPANQTDMAELWTSEPRRSTEKRPEDFEDGDTTGPTSPSQSTENGQRVELWSPTDNIGAQQILARFHNSGLNEKDVISDHSDSDNDNKVSSLGNSDHTRNISSLSSSNSPSGGVAEKSWTPSDDARFTSPRRFERDYKGDPPILRMEETDESGVSEESQESKERRELEERLRGERSWVGERKDGGTGSSPPSYKAESQETSEEEKGGERGKVSEETSEEDKGGGHAEASQEAPPEDERSWMPSDDAKYMPDRSPDHEPPSSKPESEDPDPDLDPRPEERRED